MPRSKSGTGVRSHRCSCDQSHIRSDGTSYLSPFPQLSHSFLVKYIVLPTPLCGVPCPCYVAAAAKIRTLLSQETRATGKTLSEPACKKKWGEVKCISLPSIRHPPKPNLPHRCLSRYQKFFNNTTTFTRRGLANCGLCFHYCLGQWTQGDWIGPGGSNQAAPSTAYQCANKRLVHYGAKNQTIQLPTSLAAQSLSSAKFLDSQSSSKSRRNPTTSSSLLSTRPRRRRPSQCLRLLSLKLN